MKWRVSSCTFYAKRRLFGLLPSVPPLRIYCRFLAGWEVFGEMLSRWTPNMHNNKMATYQSWFPSLLVINVCPLSYYGIYPNIIYTVSGPAWARILWQRRQQRGLRRFLRMRPVPCWWKTCPKRGAHSFTLPRPSGFWAEETFLHQFFVYIFCWGLFSNQALFDATVNNRFLFSVEH
jgi:hypothetical protein